MTHVQDTYTTNLHKFLVQAFSARQHKLYATTRYMPSPARLASVRLSVTRVDQSKTVEVRITTFAP